MYVAGATQSPEFPLVNAVQAAGYRSNSKSFKNIVNQQLIKERKRFSQVDRGLYGLTKK